ncbi:MAG: hypothetical protein ACERKO_04100 [Acetanaerobacterium sp.]
MQISTIKVNTGRPYHVVVGTQLLPLCGGYVRQVTKARVAAIVTDDNVSPLYADTVEQSLRSVALRLRATSFRTASRARA